MPDRPATNKPTITDDHLKRLDSIMGTPVASKSPSPTPASAKSSSLSFIPKPSGIANKMFIFTGKKKIIIDGKDKEEEKIKTINPATSQEVTRVETPTFASVNDRKIESPKVPTEIITKTTIEPEKKDPTQAPVTTAAPGEKKTEEKKVKKGGKIPFAFLVVFFFVFLGAWTLFWLVFFGYIAI